MFERCLSWRFRFRYRWVTRYFVTQIRCGQGFTCGDVVVILYDENVLSQICNVWAFITRKNVRTEFFIVQTFFKLPKYLPWWRWFFCQRKCCLGVKYFLTPQNLKRKVKILVVYGGGFIYTYYVVFWWRKMWLKILACKKVGVLYMIRLIVGKNWVEVFFFLKIKKK